MIDCLKSIIVATGVSLICVTNAEAHPNHISIAEMQYNAKSGKLEIALRAWPVDLEKSLRISTGSYVDLDKTENVDALLTGYLQKAFVVKQKEGKPLTIEWVGKEIGLKHAWLYFQIPVASLENLEFSNRVCFEAERTQTNTILFKHNKQRMTLECTQQKPASTLELGD